MTRVRRLLVVLAGLAVIAVVNSGPSWGLNPQKNDPNKLLPKGKAQQAEAKPADAEAALAQSRITGAPLLTYQPAKGDPYFSLQVKPNLGAVPRRPRDILLVLSTDASQAGPSWHA